MPVCRSSCRSVLWAALLCGALPAVAQQYAGPPGTPVDRNVADVSANAASLRLAQPGIGQFGVGSLLLDRQAGDPLGANRFDPFAGDRRTGTGHRYMLQAPGVTALMNQANYIGPSPRGGWVRNEQTYDGTEILTYGPDTVFVLSPELMRARQEQPGTPALQDPHTLVRPTPLAIDLAANPVSRLTGHEPLQRVPFLPQHPEVEELLRRNPNYVHPEIIERRRRLKAEREAQAAAEQAAQTAEPSAPENPEAHEDKAETSK